MPSLACRFASIVRISFAQDGPDAKPVGRGTRIELVLKEDMAEFLEERKVNTLCAVCSVNMVDKEWCAWKKRGKYRWCREFFVRRLFVCVSQAGL